MSGKVRQSTSDRFFEKVVPVPEAGCWLWMASTNKAGYGQFMLHGRPHLAHRISLNLAGTEIPDGMHVCHKCDTPACVNPDHLFLGTQQDNVSDMIRKGRMGTPVRPAGQAHPGAKITNAIALSIYRESGLYDDIAKKFGVSWRTVQTIKSGRQWNSVTGAIPKPVKKYRLKSKEFVSFRP